jgi:cytochrome P450
MATQTITLPDHVDPAIVRHVDLFDRVLRYDNPHETIVPEIHRGPAVFYADNVMFQQPGWVVRRNADLRVIYADKEHFVKRANSGFAALIGEDWNIIPTETDPPEHTAYRAALNPLFSPSRMMSLDAWVRDRSQQLIAAFKDKGECEFISDFAEKFPITIFLDLIGVPQDRLPELREWEHRLIHGTTVEGRTEAVRFVKSFIEEQVAARRKNPGDDLLSQAMATEVDGRKWTDQEIFGFGFNLFLGGLDTVTANIGLHFRHLADTPEDQETVRTNTPEQNIVAVEELLRAYAAVSTNRICSKQTEIGGYTVMPGDFVIMSTVLAGRVPEAYDLPQEVRLDRRPTHVSLGSGFHRCLGQHLARRELQAAIQEFTRAIPTFEIERGHRVQFLWSNVIQLPELPLSWH